MGVRFAGELAQVAIHLLRHVGHHLCAGRRIEHVQHAIVGGGVEHRQPVQIGIAKCRVTRVGEPRSRRTNIDGVGVYGISQFGDGAAPEICGGHAFVGAVPAQVVEAVTATGGGFNRRQIGRVPA